MDAIIPHTICAIQEQFSIRKSCCLIANKSHERTEENHSACFLWNAFGLQRQRRVEGVEPSNKAERRYLTLKPLLRSAEWGSCQVRRLKSWTLRANTSIQIASIVHMFSYWKTCKSQNFKTGVAGGGGWKSLSLLWTVYSLHRLLINELTFIFWKLYWGLQRSLHCYYFTVAVKKRKWKIYVQHVCKCGVTQGSALGLLHFLRGWRRSRPGVSATWQSYRHLMLSCKGNLYSVSLRLRVGQHKLNRMHIPNNADVISQCLTHWLYIIKMDRVIVMSSTGLLTQVLKNLTLFSRSAPSRGSRLLENWIVPDLRVYLVCVFAPICVGCTRDGNDWILSAAWAQMTTHPLARPQPCKFCICKIKVDLMNVFYKDFGPSHI